MRNLSAFATATAVVLSSFAARADYKINVSNSSSGIPDLVSYAITNVDYYVVNQTGDGALDLSGKLVRGGGNAGSWNVKITKKALQNAGMSAAELLQILKSEEKTGKDSMNVMYDIPGEHLSIVKY